MSKGMNMRRAEVALLPSAPSVTLQLTHTECPLRNNQHSLGGKLSAN